MHKVKKPIKQLEGMCADFTPRNRKQIEGKHWTRHESAPEPFYSMNSTSIVLSRDFALDKDHAIKRTGPTALQRQYDDKLRFNGHQK